MYISSKRFFLSTTILMSAIVQPAFFHSKAWAICDPIVQDNQEITCVGNDPGGIASGNFIKTTVKIPNGASIGPINKTAVKLNDSSKLFMSGDGKIAATGISHHGVFFQGGDAEVVLDDSASITTDGDLSEGILSVGAGSDVSLNDLSSISTIGENSLGIFLIGGGVVTLNDASKIQTSGLYGMGVLALGGQSAITLNNQSSINTQGDGAVGAYTSALNGTVTLNNAASISTQGVKAFGAVAKGNGGAVTLNNQSSIETFGLYAFGAFAPGDDATITLNQQSKITTHADFSHGVLIKGSNGDIVLSGNATVQTDGFAAHGLLIQGNDGTISLGDTTNISANGIAFGVAIDGNGGNVTVDTNAIVKAGAGAVAFTNGSNTLLNRGLLQANNFFAIWGDNGIGSDSITNFGTIISGGATSIALFDGNDSLTLGTGSLIVGNIDGGGDFDTVTLNGSGSENDVFLNFEDAVMNGVAWSLSGNSNFGNSLLIANGRLGIDGNIGVGAGNTTIQANGILGGTGQLTSPLVNDVGGTIAPGNGIGTLTVVGNVIQTGGAFDIEFNQNAGDLLNIVGSLTLQNSPVVNAVALGQISSLNRVIIHADNGVFGTIGDLNYIGNGAVTMIQEPNDIRLVILDGTSVVALNIAGLKGAMDYLDAVSGAQLYVDNRDPGRSRRVWGRGFGHFLTEEARDGNQAYNTRTAGSAVGGDVEVLEGLSLGLSAGYSNTNAEVAQRVANAEIDGEYAALYARYNLGDFFLNGVVTGGLQQTDVERNVATDHGRQQAEGKTDGIVYGGSLYAGYNFAIGDGLRLTPTAGVLYQHQSVDGYREQGVGRGDVRMKDQESDAIRISGQVNLAKTIDFEGFEMTPHVSIGVANEITKGGKAGGTFSDGTDFEVQLQEDSQLMGLAGAGISLGFDTGLAVSLSYQGRIADDTTDHGILADVSFKW